MPAKLILAVLVATLGAGCATRHGLDHAVLRPVATFYEERVPSPVRSGVSHFFSNLRDVASAANLFLQGRPREGFSDVGRFAINTTVGLLGFLDVATGMGLEHHGEGFGRTLVAWGVQPGAYVVWPLFGPSTVRDSVGLPVDWLSNPMSLLAPGTLQTGLVATREVDGRAAALPATRTIDAVAFDKYAFVREAYLQIHRKLAPEVTADAGRTGNAGVADDAGRTGNAGRTGDAGATTDPPPVAAAPVLADFEDGSRPVD